ncbi:PaaX family transcriptional regulator [Rudaeicoccus suwonensis]|uniref:PaaX family transcriptional regulator n=1 Tax=Rudaeicoccus suwonensis TaxID=657409 RepID=A0A561E369_9MICO|nr:PaaX family transcriptional regulator C-terminal domain-containing protein [Rudaeicoccus suwonensis]TWE10057.1 PaaX family transcriptional regulator [Rudaeicoccus suwonensis]
MSTAPSDSGSALRSDSGRQVQQFIITILATWARGEHSVVPVADLIGLMASLDVDPPAVRSALARLKKREVLLSARAGRAAAYELNPRLERIFAEGDARIFHPQRAAATDPWLVALFTVPEAERSSRHLLRKRLTNLGFGTIAPGSWIAPAHLLTATKEALQRDGLDHYVEMFVSRPDDATCADELRHKVAQWWDLDELHRQYAEFVTRYAPLHDDHTNGRTTDAAAFATYVRLVTDWRRLPYRDPGLPVAYLPADWVGLVAEQLFTDLHRQLSAPATALVR